MPAPRRHIPIVKADPHDRDPREPAALKGRGTAWAIASRYATDERSAFDDGWGTLDEQVAVLDGDGAGVAAQVIETQVTEQHVRSILATNESPDIPFDQSINPYRGCEHGCIYCFARPTHAYLDGTKIGPLTNLSEDVTLAARDALLKMIDWLVQNKGLTRQQAYALASVAVDLRISNLVDTPNVAVSAILDLGVFDRAQGRGHHDDE